MSRKLKGVETLSDDKTATTLLGFAADDFTGGSDEGGVVAEGSCSLDLSPCVERIPAPGSRGHPAACNGIVSRHRSKMTLRAHIQKF